SSSGGSLTPISGTPVLSKVQSVDQRMRLGNAVSAFVNCGRAVAHVRGIFHFGATLGWKSGTGRSILVLPSPSGGGLTIGFQIKWEGS
ncbi:MAG: hypothetical protein WCB62_11115, partial [Pseudolabrys sp.]